MKNILLAFALVYVINATPLDDYVNQPDDHYKYELLKTYEMTGYKLYILNLTSQKWLDETIVSNPVWWHFLCITIPDKILRPDAGLLLIDGGDNNPNDMPKPTDNFVQLSSVFAVATGTIAADLQQIPNQPTYFKKDPKYKRRTEDAVIAWTWKTFIENPDDPSILLRLPMTKAAVRAMDAMTEFNQDQTGNKLDKFMVVGASKRGWTTWTTAAVDKRVFAAVPIVMDMLNLNQNFHKHYRSLGGWTFAFNDYYELNITTAVDTYGVYAMQKIIDPSSYYDRYTDKKILAVVTSGDEFFLGDDTHAYWNDLLAATKGSAMLRRLPNAEHSCAGHEISIFFTLRSFFLSVYEKDRLPIVRWQRNNNATHGVLKAYVDLKSGRKPSEVKVFYARTLDNKRRDFRLAVGDPDDPSKIIPHPVVWQSDTKIIRVKEETTRITYEVAFLIPVTHWLGFFMQFSFPGLENSVLQITTESNFVPDYYPFPDCTAEGCYGKLV